MDENTQDSAAHFKRTLLSFLKESLPSTRSEVLSRKADALRNRVSLARLNFKGSKSWYAIVRTADSQQRLLVLKVPPLGFQSKEQQKTHAMGQATYQDNLDDVYAPGLRVKPENWKQYLSEHDYQELRHGNKLSLKYVPARFHRRNYQSCLDLAPMVDEDIARLKKEGFVEGPLHYVPHVVLPMGAVFTPEKNKFRLVMDATRAGVNPAQVPLETKYDLLDDALPRLRPDDKLSKIDMTDAFFHWSTAQPDCDLQGIQSAAGDFYRLRYTYF